MTNRQDDKISAFVLELVDDPPTAPEIDFEAAKNPVPNQLHRTPPQRRASVPVFAIAGAALLILVAIGLPVLLFSGGNSEVVDTAVTTEPSIATTLPATTEAPATTITATPTTAPATTAAPIPVSPPNSTWERIVDEAFHPGNVLAITSNTDVVVAVGEVTDWTGSIWPDSPTPQGVVWVSTDGRSWDRIDDESVFGSDNHSIIWDVAAGPQGFVASGQDHIDAALWFSPDGYTWEKVLVDDLGNSRELTQFAVTSTALGWVALDNDDDPGDFVFTSRDGFRWQRINDPAAAMDYIGAVAASTEPLPLTTPTDFRDFAWDGERVIAVAAGGPAGVSIWLSEDSGASWQRVDPEQEVFSGGWLPPQSIGVTLFGSEIIVGGNSADEESVAGQPSTDAAMWIGHWADTP